ncbi:DUF2254 domain-containing protein [Peribacillus sp. SCS-155]|uniref:DUF2254 domain-containing protein n=1 Tax=Peribacillus sedimenti TaxID=3115297 RepID=UPI00390637CD
MSQKFIINKIKASFWFVPGLIGIVFFLLAVFTMMLDGFIAQNAPIISKIPSIFLTDRELAQTILSAISTSLLTMTTITFSSILVVQTTFLAQFSPRTLQNFNANAKTQTVLGCFLGGYIYAIVLLLHVKDNGEREEFIVPAFVILVAFFCLSMFVFVIHHVSHWIKVGNLISDITRDTLSSIKENERENEDAGNKRSDQTYPIEESELIKIKSSKQGYIQYVELTKLVGYAETSDVVIKFEKALGDYVDIETPLLSVVGSAERIDASEILSYIFLTSDQESINNVEFGLQKLAEIALRAIAPGKNDPETAINCIEQMAQILTKVGKKHSENPNYTDGTGRIRVIIEKPAFSDFLYESFYQIRHYGKADVSVMAAIVKALILIAETNKQEIKELVWNFSKYILEGLKKEDWLALDKEYLNHQLRKLARACEQESQEQQIFLA